MCTETTRGQSCKGHLKFLTGALSTTVSGKTAQMSGEELQGIPILSSDLFSKTGKCFTLFHNWSRRMSKGTATRLAVSPWGGQPPSAYL